MNTIKLKIHAEQMKHDKNKITTTTEEKKKKKKQKVDGYEHEDYYNDDYDDDDDDDYDDDKSAHHDQGDTTPAPRPMSYEPIAGYDPNVHLKIHAAVLARILNEAEEEYEDFLKSQLE